MEGYQRILQRYKDFIQYSRTGLRSTQEFNRKRRFAAEVENAKRLVMADLVKWTEGEIYNVYPARPFRVENTEEGYICPCSTFEDWGFCSHIIAVRLKEGE